MDKDVTPLIGEPRQFAPDWPSARIGVEICHYDSLSEDSVAIRWQWGLALSAAELQGWCVAAMAAVEGLADRFPWQLKDLGELAELGADMPRGKASLGELQAIAALMWLLEPAYGQFDAESAPEIPSKLRCSHAIQMPGSKESDNGTPGSEDAIRVGYAFLRVQPGLFEPDADPAARAAALMADALGRFGALPEGCLRSDQRAMPPSWEPSSGWSMAYIDRFANLWEQIDIARAANGSCVGDSKRAHRV